MYLLKRDTQVIWLCNPLGGEQDAVDSDGYLTGEKVIQYDAPVPITAIVSEPTGRIVHEMFGADIRYDKVIILTNKDADGVVRNGSVLFVDKVPRPGRIDQQFDYIVRRIARSHNYTAVALKRVDVL